MASSSSASDVAHIEYAERKGVYGLLQHLAYAVVANKPADPLAYLAAYASSPEGRRALTDAAEGCAQSTRRVGVSGGNVASTNKAPTTSAPEGGGQSQPEQQATVVGSDAAPADHAEEGHNGDDCDQSEGPEAAS